MAKHLYTYLNPPRERDLEEISKCLLDDGVIAMRLDVAWSFLCDASLPKALERLSRLKPEHPQKRPFSLICENISMVSTYANVDHQIYPLLKRAFPGPYTLILSPHVRLPKILHTKRPEIGIRVPDAPLLRDLFRIHKRPLIATTVPLIPVEKDLTEPVTAGWQVEAHFGHSLDLIADTGEESPHFETTVIDLVDLPPKLIRRGLGELSIFGLAD